MESINTDFWSLFGLGAAGFVVWAIGAYFITLIGAKLLKWQANALGVTTILWTVLCTAVLFWWLSAIWHNCGA